MHYALELGNRELKTVFKKFASIQNRILIDYKRLRDYLAKRVYDIQDANTNIKNLMGEFDQMSIAQSRCASQMDRMSQLSNRTASNGFMANRLKTNRDVTGDINTPPLSKSVLLDKHNLEKLRRQHQAITEQVNERAGSNAGSLERSLIGSRYGIQSS